MPFQISDIISYIYNIYTYCIYVLQETYCISLWDTICSANLITEISLVFTIVYRVIWCPLEVKDLLLYWYWPASASRHLCKFSGQQLQTCPSRSFWKHRLFKLKLNHTKTVSCPRTFGHLNWRSWGSPTFWLVDNLPYLLSHSQPNMWVLVTGQEWGSCNICWQHEKYKNVFVFFTIFFFLNEFQNVCVIHFNTL